MRKVGYVCAVCHNTTVVVDHSGKALPATIQCGAPGACNTGTAWFSMLAIPPNAVASHKTFPPNEDEINRADPVLKAHGQSGGVFIRSKRE